MHEMFHRHPSNNQRPLHKINHTGQFQYFPGVNVISGLFEHQPEVCDELFTCLSEDPLLIPYYSPLPAESYHMTAFGVLTRNDVSGDWESFVDQRLPFFQAINAELTRSGFSPALTVKNISVATTIQLVVELPQEQIDIIDSLARRFHCAHERPNVFHITLAYQYRPVSPVNVSKMKASVKENIDQILKSNPPILLPSPQLHCFNDMSLFKRWDAQQNPFKETLGSLTFTR
jgi:hypothetical protein